MLVDNPVVITYAANRIIDHSIETAIKLCNNSVHGDALIEKFKQVLLTKNTSDLAIVLKAHEGYLRRLRPDIIDAILATLVERAFFSGGSNA